MWRRHPKYGQFELTDQAWTVKRSRHVVQDRWISLRADDCVTSRGVEIAPYYVIERPGTVHVLASDQANRIVLVRQYRHAYGGLSLELPGGLIDAGETDVLAVAARELREETGYGGGHFEFAAALSVDPARYTNRINLVLAIGVAPGHATPEPTEDIEVVLMPRADLHALACSGGIINVAHLGLILLAFARANEARALG